MKPSLRRILDAARAFRSRKTPGWALPTCYQCRISMRETETEGTFVCPKCKFEYTPGAGDGQPLLNEDLKPTGEI